MKHKTFVCLFVVVVLNYNLGPLSLETQAATLHRKSQCSGYRSLPLMVPFKGISNTDHVNRKTQRVSQEVLQPSQPAVGLHV